MPDVIPPVAPRGALITDLSSLTTPAPSLTSALEGAAAAAPPVAPAAPAGPMWNGRALPSLDSNLETAASFSPDAYKTLHDPTASPFDKTMAGARQYLDVEPEYRQLTNMGAPIDRMLNFFQRQDPNAPSMDAQADAASIYSDPRVKALVTSDPQWFDAAKSKPVEFAQVLKQMLHHADGAPATTTPGGKTVDDPEGVQMKAAISGAGHDAAHASHEPGKYTKAEFIKLMGGLSWNQAGKLWQMQHYQPPQQQMMIAVMNEMGKHRNAALTRYNALKAQGAAANPAALAKAKELYEHHDKLYWDTAGRYTSPQTYALPSMGNFGGGTE